MPVAVKICGVTDALALDAAVAGGARWIGLVFYPPSPRALAPPLAAELARRVPAGIKLVGVFVDPDDALLESVLTQVPLDLVQLHGAESPARVAGITGRFPIRAIKALAIRDADDLMQVGAYAGVADALLFDAKPPKGVASLPGGNALSFDWSLLEGRQFPLPWLLAGGLDESNLEDAVRISGAEAVDVSSGVEDRPGHKDPAAVTRFLDLARRL